MSYMIISCVILIAAIVPFFRMYEKRQPKAREVVLIAMYTAITCAAQIAFHVTVPIQAGTALVIIAGISMGPEVGFLIGALARLVMNFYLGQGPWTPWQMFSYGLLGFMAGMAFNKAVAENKFETKEKEVMGIEMKKERDFKVILGPVLFIIFGVVIAYITYMLFPWKDETFWGWRVYAGGLLGLITGVIFQIKRLPIDSLTLTLFTFFVTVIIYGGIMNIAAVVTAIGVPGTEFNLDTLRIWYVSGLPYDLYHALTAALTIFIIGPSMITKLERIKIKYGIYRR